MSELLQAKELDAHEAAHHQLTIAPGIPKEGETYFHYKGGLYQVMAVGLKEDTLEPMIAYQSFVSGYNDFRTLANWQETIVCEGEEHPRFEKYDHIKHHGRVKYVH